MKGRKKRKKTLGCPLKYSDEQMEFFRMLLQEDKCHFSIITKLTGVPGGTAGHLRYTFNIKNTMRHTRPFNGRVARMRRVQTLTRLKAKYAEQLEQLFGKT